MDLSTFFNHRCNQKADKQSFFFGSAKFAKNTINPLWNEHVHELRLLVQKMVPARQSATEVIYYNDRGELTHQSEYCNSDLRIHIRERESAQSSVLTQIAIKVGRVNYFARYYALLKVHHPGLISWLYLKIMLNIWLAFRPLFWFEVRTNQSNF